MFVRGPRGPRRSERPRHVIDGYELFRIRSSQRTGWCRGTPRDGPRLPAGLPALPTLADAARPTSRRRGDLFQGCLSRGGPSRARRRLPGPVVVALAWLAGSVPFSNIAAHRRAQVDLRDVGNGTVSGTALHEVAGFGPLAAAGLCDVAKGTVGPVLAGGDRPMLGAMAASAGIVGHNWSPWLRGAGGRGLSVAFGAFLPLAWPGTVVLALGLALGRLARRSGLGSFLGAVALVPVVARTHGRAGAAAGVGVVTPLLAKRVAGNRPPARPTVGAYAHRLLFDNDAEPAAGPPPGAGRSGTAVAGGSEPAVERGRSRRLLPTVRSPR